VVLLGFYWYALAKPGREVAVTWKTTTNLLFSHGTFHTIGTSEAYVTSILWGMHLTLYNAVDTFTILTHVSTVGCILQCAFNNMLAPCTHG
jgi:hypothetical protein